MCFCFYCIKEGTTKKLHSIQSAAVLGLAYCPFLWTPPLSLSVCRPVPESVLVFMVWRSLNTFFLLSVRHPCSIAKWDILPPPKKKCRGTHPSRGAADYSLRPVVLFLFCVFFFCCVPFSISNWLSCEGGGGSVCVCVCFVRDEFQRFLIFPFSFFFSCLGSPAFFLRALWFCFWTVLNISAIIQTFNSCSFVK